MIKCYCNNRMSTLAYFLIHLIVSMYCLLCIDCSWQQHKPLNNEQNKMIYQCTGLKYKNRIFNDWMCVKDFSSSHKKTGTWLKSKEMHWWVQTGLIKVHLNHLDTWMWYGGITSWGYELSGTQPQITSGPVLKSPPRWPDAYLKPVTLLNFLFLSPGCCLTFWCQF